MAKVTINPVGNLESQTSAVQTLDDNFNRLATAIENTVSRDGTTPNAMSADFDMNGKRILNVGTPVSSTDAVRFIDIYSGVTLTDHPIPNPSGNTGKLLGTADGITISWITAAGDLLSTNNLSDLDNIATARTNLGLGTAATQTIGTSGGTVPLLNTINTFSVNQAFTGGIQVSNGARFVGTTEATLEYSGLSSLSDVSVGFRGAPQTVMDADYTFQLEDAGRGFSHTSATGHVWYVPTHAQVAFPIHTMIVISNYGTGAVTLAMADPPNQLLRVNGSGASANQTVPQYYVRTLFKQGANAWVLL